jgi:hypothetical protein
VLTTVALLITGAWALLKIMVRQYDRSLDQRFAAQEAVRVDARASYEKQFNNLENMFRDLEREFLKHIAQLPKEYVRREDAIRSETVINAKLDALAVKIDMVAERQQRA